VFYELVQNLDTEIFRKAVGIIDEFDSIIFSGENSLQMAT
jgi:hypothetical protein